MKDYELKGLIYQNHLISMAACIIAGFTPLYSILLITEKIPVSVCILLIFIICIVQISLLVNIAAILHKTLHKDKLNDKLGLNEKVSNKSE